MPVFGASLGLVGATIYLSRRRVQYTGHLAGSLAVRVLTIAALISLFVYAATIRPHRQPFSFFPPSSALAGTRDFREDSLANLAFYVSWPILLAGLGGVCYMIWRRWLPRTGFLRPFVLIFGLGPALVYLWFPDISPDQPWAFRRF